MYIPAVQNENQTPTIKFTESTLSRTNCYKYLVLELDAKLTFIPQMNSLRKIISHKLCLLRRIRSYLTINASL